VNPTDPTAPPSPSPLAALSPSPVATRVAEVAGTQRLPRAGASRSRSGAMAAIGVGGLLGLLALALLHPVRGARR